MYSDFYCKQTNNMNYRKKTYDNPKTQEEPKCVVCAVGFYFREPNKPYGPKCPLILHCGHSACEGCVSSAIVKNIVLNCPVCGTVSEPKKFDPKNLKRSEMLSLREEFPLNVYAVGQVSLRKNKALTGDSFIKFSPSNKKSDKNTGSTAICVECNESPAQCMCIQCDVNMCHSCFTKVHNSVTLRKHEKSSLKDKKTFEFFLENICKDHKGFYLNIFCKDCEKYICKECIVENHLEHRCTDVFQQNEEKLPEFSQLYDEAHSVLKRLHTTKKKLQQPGAKNHQLQDEECLKVEKQIQAHYNYLHGLLQRHEEQMLQKVRCVGEAAKTSLQDVAADLDSNIKEIEEILTVSNSVITTNKVKEIPLGHLMDKLRNVAGAPCHLVLMDEDVSKFEIRIDSTILETLTGHVQLDVPTNRKYELRTKDELPEAYTVENLDNVPDIFVKPDLSLLMTTKNKGDALLNALIPLSPTKTRGELRESNPLTNENRLRERTESSSTLSTKSQESCVDRISKVEPLAEGSSEIVKMSHLTSANDFYVQRKCNFGDIEKIREYFSRNSNRARKPPSEVEYGQLYLVQYSKDKKWYRGRVVKLDRDLCDVFYVDYGNTENNVPKNKLREIPDKFAEMPDQALHCGLLDCNPANGTWSTEAHTYLITMAMGKELSMYVKRIDHKSGFHEVYLQSADATTGSFTDALVFAGHAYRTESTDKEQGMFKQSAFVSKKNAFKSTMIKESDVFDGQVTHIVSPAHFYMQKITDGGELLMNLMRDLGATYSGYSETQGQIFTPSVGMAVAAKFPSDGSWYRAVVLNVPEPRKVLVKYIDFGNVAQISLNDMRELQPRFLRTCAQALKCSLNDIAPKHPKGWPASSKKAFEKLALGKGLMRAYVDKVKDDNDNTVSIVLYETTPTKYINISGVLVKKGHALSTGRSSARAEYLCSQNVEVMLHHLQSMPADAESVFSEHSGSSDKVSGHSVGSPKDAISVNRQSADQPLLPIQKEKMGQNTDARVKVEVLKITSPSEVYVTSGSTRKLITNLVNEMTMYYQHTEPETERDWTVGDFCAVHRSKDKQWYRGVISETTRTAYKVFIKDIAEYVEVDRSELRTLDPKFFPVPDGSTKVHLGGIRPPAALKVWPSSTTDYLKLLLEESDSLYIEKLGEVVNQSIPVRFWRRTQTQRGPLDPVKDEWCDVNESIISIGFALRDGTRNDTVLNSDTPMGVTYVMQWLDSTFKPIDDQQKERSVVTVASTAPYVTELEQDQSNYVKTDIVPEKARSIAGEKTRPRGNRGRTPSQRAAYIPSMMTTGLEEITEWKPAAPFKSLDFLANPTYVDYECNIYIQDTSSASTLDLLEKAFLSVFANTEMKPHEQTYVEGQICIAFYDLTKKWYRGQVLKVKREHIEVLFVDYGNVEEMQPEKLRKQVTMGHIPIQCHKCRTEGIIPISPDGKWSLPALDFVHVAVVDQKCEVSLKAPSETCEDYVILSLKMPGGEDLFETLLSMHYATYFIDPEQMGEGNDDEEIIIDGEIEQAFSNNQASKGMALEIQNVCSNYDSLKSVSNVDLRYENNDEGEGSELIEDRVRALQIMGPDAGYSWYEETESANQVLETETFISELDTIPRLDVKFKEMILPDSVVEYTVEVLIVCSYNSVKVMITECDDLEVMATINEFLEMQELMQTEAESSPLLTYPEKDLACIGCFTDDDTWYRAVITDVADGLVSVYYVDYGNVEELPLNRLREIKPEWTLTPVQAIKVNLYNVIEGPRYDKRSCSIAFSECFKANPFTMAIESRFPTLQVEIYNDKGEVPYKPLLDLGLIAKIS